MKPSLQLNIGQHLTLTPQLQQAIRLLQLSTIDLQQEIQSILESNPMLDAIAADEKEKNIEVSKQTLDEYGDVQWSQLYSNTKPGTFNDSDYNLENLYSTTTTLQDHLHWQLNLTSMSDVERVIATTLIDAINDEGLLTQTLAELHTTLNSDNLVIAQDEIETIRHQIQNFDPVGCGSLNLSECISVQLDTCSEATPYKDLTQQIIHNDIELLAQHNYPQLMKNYQVDESTIKTIIENIQRLNPKPGQLIHQNITEYIIPDINVKKIQGVWNVALNQEILPRLSINHQYASLIQRANNSADNQFLKNNLQEARWFMKSIQSRQDTLLKVATAIVEYQQDFFDKGDEAMKPLILNDIALALDMHESTISRVTTQKYMNTPRGVFELKYFFSSHVGTTTGGECSSTAIRAVIKKLIAAENRKKPLSDSKISQMIEAQGIQIARRTVAKYREAMGIAPSHERKSLYH